MTTDVTSLVLDDMCCGGDSGATSTVGLISTIFFSSVCMLSAARTLLAGWVGKGYSVDLVRIY